MSTLLEVIAASVADAREAEAGGADRLELLIGPECGGLTPPIALVQEVLETVRIPVRAMLRIRPAMDVESTDELDELCRTAEEFSHLSVNGLVAGFVRAGKLNRDALRRVCEAAGRIPITFHRAFDFVENQTEALPELTQFSNIDRLLTPGSGYDARERYRSAQELQTKAPSQIRILFAAGSDIPQLAALRPGEPMLEFHVGRAARKAGTYDSPVCPRKIRNLKYMLARLDQ